MRVPNDVHTSRSWRIDEIAGDFRLEDVWELPGDVGGDDFGRLVAHLARLDPSQSSSFASRTLFAIRWKLGELFGWDEAGDSAATLRDRLPADLRDGPSGPPFASLPFTSLYLTADEWAAEAANRTMHGVLHLSRVGDRARLAVYVKPNGLLGHAYMAFIKPFRHLIVYPRMLSQLGRSWERERERQRA